LKQRLDAQAAEPFMPHVSLLYGPVAPEPKAAAAAEIRRRLKGRAVSFDRLCVVRSGQDTPIADWRVVATARLG
jgi:2'-5' RNA ligase